jgi:hypothetical protein
MAEESEEIISEYTDVQALEDGMLDEVHCGALNRVTHAAFTHYALSMENRFATKFPLGRGLYQDNREQLTGDIRIFLGCA